MFEVRNIELVDNRQEVRINNGKKDMCRVLSAPVYKIPVCCEAHRGTPMDISYGKNLEMRTP